MSIWKLMVPIGIIFNLIMILAVLTGLRWIKVKFGVHRLLALIGFFGSLIHAAIGIYITYFK
jgi:hypothetical protein